MVKPHKTIFLTGVHHTPAIELIRQLQTDKKYHWQIHYFSHNFNRDTHLKKTIIPLLNDHYHDIHSVKFDRYNPINTITQIPTFFWALLHVIKSCRKYRPDIIVSFGGYVSVPVILSGYFLKIPSISHEQTVITGISTKINAIFNKKIALSFPIPLFHPHKTVVTGNLLRQDIFKLQFPRSFSFTKPLIYITGGSQGSQFLNELVQKILPKLTNKFQIIHQIGNQALPPTQNNYLPLPYLDGTLIGPVLNHSKIIISRSGANICSEIDALQKKAILIPLPSSQQNEQQKNALWLKKKHSQNIILISQNKCSKSSVLRAIKKLSSHKNTPPQPHHPNLKLLQLIHETI